MGAASPVGREQAWRRLLARCLRSAAAAAACMMLCTLVSAPAWARLAVFACEPEWGALVQELGKEHVSLYTATTALQDPHQIEAKPSLVARLRGADLLVCTGAELEIGWLPVLQRQAANGAVQPGAAGFFEAARYVPLLAVPKVVDRGHGHVHGAGNPHIQTAAPNYGAVATALAERLAQLDPAHADAYAANHRDFAQRWEAAMARWEERAQPLKGKWVLVHHEGWTYLLDWLGLWQAGTLEPKPGVPPSTQHLNTVLTRIQTRPVSMVIRSAFDDPRASVFLSQRAGVPQVVLPATVGGDAGTQDLFGYFDTVIGRLLDGLAGRSTPGK